MPQSLWTWGFWGMSKEQSARRLVDSEVHMCMSFVVQRMMQTDDVAVEMIYEAIEDAAEVYEWWAVSDWLGEKLQEAGEVVIDDYWGVTLWGRQCTGQAIYMDYVIQKVLRDVEDI